MARRKGTELNITDPTQLRALAHPARQRLITELYSGEVLTATRAAELVGLSPSATSYHLRALEKAGIVVRDESTSDARQRPWRAAAESLSIKPEAHRAAGTDASRASLLGWLTDLDTGLDRASRAMATGRQDVGHTSRGRLWLNENEVREIGDRVREIYDEYQGRRRENHPEDTVLWDTYLLVLPAEDHGDDVRDS